MLLEMSSASAMSTPSPLTMVKASLLWGRAAATITSATAARRSAVSRGLSVVRHDPDRLDGSPASE